MTLALLSVASFMAEALLSLANRCEPSSHASPSRITNITMLSLSLTDFDYIVCVKVICLVYFIEDRFLGDAFVFALAVAITMFIAFLRVFREG